MENLNYENESMERKYLKIWKNQFLKAKNSILELEKDFIELKDTEFERCRSKIKREIKEFFFKPIIVTIDDIDSFENKRKEENKTN